MELWLSRQEFAIIQLAAIVWGAYHSWDSLANFAYKYPHTRALIREFLNGRREAAPPPNNPQPAN